ncbi:MAG: hypothetical protein IJK13_04895 [Lachnospiraceae bacterium]|nr:hypothetical protein [Lachnospiraceae bacterium]
MGKESEDYLDSLLNAVQEEIPRNIDGTVDSLGIGQGETNEDELMGDPFEVRKEKRKEKTRKPKRDASDAFLAEFEKELMETDAGDFLSDFELDMSGNMDADEYLNESADEAGPGSIQEPVPVGKAPEETFTEAPADTSVENFNTEEDSLFNGLDAIMNSEEPANIPMEASNDILMAPESDMPGDAAPDAGDASLEMNFGATEETDIPGDLFGMPDMSQDMASSDVPGVSDVMEEAGLGLGALGFGDDSADGDTAVASEMPGEDASADDIISMLNGLGEGDEDLKDIGSMLSADENGESIMPEGEDISAAELAGNLAGLGFDIDVQVSSGSDGEIRDITDERNALIKEANEKKEPPKGFLGKLKALFFGSDDEEEDPNVPVIANAKKKDIDEIAGELADEDAEILRALEGGGEEPTAEAEPELDEKAKKAKEKEEKKKEKEAKKKEKAAAKAAAKAAKPPKVKKPKPPKVKTKPLPKGPVFVILLLGATILFGTIYIGKAANYRMSIYKAQEYYAQGKYVEAYNLLNPLTIEKDDDKLLYRKVKMLACMQEFYRSYEVLVSSGRNELALDSLVRMIGHYDVQINDAGEYGISAELTDYEGKAERLLKEVYNVSFEDALALYKQRDRQTYSMELIKVLLRAGIS